MPNHGHLRGRPVLSIATLLVQKEGIAEEMKAVREPG